MKDEDDRRAVEREIAAVQAANREAADAANAEKAEREKSQEGLKAKLRQTRLLKQMNSQLVQKVSHRMAFWVVFLWINLLSGSWC